MVVVRCTRKLLRRLEHKSAEDGDPAKSTTRRGDWCLNLLIVRRQHLVLGVSSLTLLSALLAAAPYESLIARFSQAVGDVLHQLGIDATKIATEERPCAIAL